MLVIRLAVALAISLVAAATPQETEEPTLRTPSMPAWKLLKKIDPEYPATAVQHRIQGTVRFSVTIAKDGHIERVRLISGHPLLVRAAREAVQQWIYRPTLLNGRPVRVITEIAVPFQLDPYGKPEEGPIGARTGRRILAILLPGEIIDANPIRKISSLFRPGQRLGIPVDCGGRGQ